MFGNILLGGGIGWAVGSARGADNKYADVVTVTMVPMAQAAPETVKVDPNGKVTALDTEEPVEKVTEEVVEETASEESTSEEAVSTENPENNAELLPEEGIDENIKKTVEDAAEEMETPAEMDGQADIQ